MVPQAQLERFVKALERKGMRVWKNKRVYLTDTQHLQMLDLFPKYEIEAHGGEKMYMDSKTGEIIASNIHDDKNDAAKKAFNEFVKGLFK